MSKAAKGNAFQDWCAKWICESHPGSVVHNQKAVARAIPIVDPKTKRREVRWVSQRNDIFGCIDLIWTSSDKPITWIQCTMDPHIERKEKELRKIPWPPWTLVQLWVKRGPGKVDIFAMLDDNMKLIAKIEKRRCVPCNTFGSGSSSATPAGKPGKR
jgi:hypothetical protein